MCHTESGFPAFSATLLSVTSPMLSKALVVLSGAACVTCGSAIAFHKARGYVGRHKASLRQTYSQERWKAVYTRCSFEAPRTISLEWLEAQ
jgi:hypothetical protein